jgi:hypothetical protein
VRKSTGTKGQHFNADVLLSTLGMLNSAFLPPLQLLNRFLGDSFEKKLFFVFGTTETSPSIS